ncbi:MAG: hypothetical protein KAJ55_17080, partial [Anaerolineales bacterium]|nr:hypothetical protein [Anaerolineales bacterium]
MRKVLMVLLAVVLSLSMVLVGCAEEEAGLKPVIKVADLNWGSAHFQAEVAKIIIEEGYGYPVELVPGKTVNMWQALRLGEVEVYMEAWTANMKE